MVGNYNGMTKSQRRFLRRLKKRERKRELLRKGREFEAYEKAHRFGTPQNES